METFYRTKNLRSLSGEEWIALKPLTILIGRNSAGKSTFLRSMSLLRQSIETRAGAPILWYGERADFGNFKDAARDHDNTKSISFAFRADNFELETSPEGDAYFSRSGQRTVSIETANIEVKVRSANKKTVYQDITVEAYDGKSVLRFSFPEASGPYPKITIDGRDTQDLAPGIQVLFNRESIFENPVFVQQVPASKDGGRRYMSIPWRHYLVRQIASLISEVASKRLKEETIRAEVRRAVGHRATTETPLSDVFATGRYISLDRVFRKLDEEVDGDTSKKIRSLLALYHSLDIFHRLNSIASDYFQSVVNIGPARVRSERFYRQQELQVVDIASDGHNLPNFLASLNRDSIKDFSDWVEASFGYGVEIEQTESHISIMLVQGGARINVVDTGYGVSQLLPILAQIWSMQRDSSKRRRRTISQNPTSTLLVEQPELHLHPAHQAMLADVFSSALKRKRREGQPCMVVETHSEALIQRIGELVEVGDISPEDINIVIFANHDGVTKFSQAGYNSDGSLANWKFGFFNYDI